MQSSQDPQPNAVTYKWEGYHNHRGPEGRGVQIPHWAPQLRKPALGRQAPIMSGFENQRAYVGLYLES